MKRFIARTFDVGFMDTLSAGDSILHRLDPRALLYTTAVFVLVVVSFGRYECSALVPFCMYPLALVAAGKLPLGYFARKALIIVPFAVVIGAFNPLLDREVLLRFGAVGISGGWVSLVSLLLRAVLTVSGVLMLVALTGFNAVCASLLRFGVPRVFVMQLLFLYRYLFVLLEEAGRMARARAARSAPGSRMGLSLFSVLIGQLLLRTLDRAERVFQAMRCRGYDGTVPLLRAFRFGWREWLFTGGWTVTFIVLRTVNVPVAMGTLVTGGMR